MPRQSGDGLIVWYDLMSTDTSVTDAFYTELFGWSFATESDAPNGYRLISNDTQPFGGTLTIGAPMQSAWMAYIQVSELDLLVERAVESGANIIMPRTEAPGAGHWSIIVDPTGAPVYLMELLPHRRSDQSRYHTGDGHVIWNELITTDVGAAGEFYRNIAGWSLNPVAPGLNPYTVAKADGAPVAGLFQPATAPANSMWVVSFQTDDIDTTIAQVQELGGRVVHPANTVPGIGRTAWVADPTGALFGLMQPETGWLERL